MKKHILFLVLALSVLPVSAQFFFSGSLGFDMTQFSRTQGFDKTLPQGKSFHFTPRVGYTFSPQIQAGLSLSVANSIYSSTDGIYDRDKEQWIATEIVDRTRATFGGGLFLRYLFAHTGYLSYSVEISASYAYGLGVVTLTQYDYRSNFPIYFKTPHNLSQFSLKFVPLVSYGLNTHFSLDIYLDFLSLIYSRTVLNQQKIYEFYDGMAAPDPVPDYTLTTSDLHLGLNSATPQYLSIGLTYTL